MRIVSSFPRDVVDIENVFIPMRDGVRLAARIWLPAGAELSPVPAILEYIPYRKRDRMRERDEPMHRYFAGHGYAAVRVDLRGTGDSEGLLLDEYHEQEIEDALEILRWLADRPWCTGNVGMMGKSWGGFNALQVAARRPKELGAIVTVCASDDRFSDDAHFMGGCLLNENQVWGSVLLTLSALPPDPEVWGDRWRELWMKRLENAPLFPEIWLRHQRRDSYWKRGSVSEDYQAIQCPVYAVGGWADAYTNAIPRLLARLTAPRKGLIGPWAHLYPHNAVPGPAIGFLQEALRWWNHWLLGQDTNVMNEPMLRVWMPEGGSEGRWVAEPSWPSKNVEPVLYHVTVNGLRDEAGTDALLSLSSPLTVGTAAGSWCPFGIEELPLDQRADDARSLLFDSPPLSDRVEILGAPKLRLRLASDRPIAMIAARLEDVFPDGASMRVSYGLLNLTRRESYEDPSPLVPGAAYDVLLDLNDAAHAFLPGHRIRLALSTSYWPIVWPAPERFTLELSIPGCRFEIPVRTPHAEDANLRPFEPPESAPNTAVEEIHKARTSTTVGHDDQTEEVVYETTADFTEDGEPALTRVLETRTEHGHGMQKRFSLTQGDPLSVTTEVLQEAKFRRDGWSVRVRTSTRFTCDRERVFIECELEGFEGEDRVFSEARTSSVPRDLL